MTKRTILCNTTTQVMGTIPWTRAITLIFAGKAISISDTDTIISSPSTDIFLPEIIMLTDYVNDSHQFKEGSPERPISKRVVHKRDNWVCAYCGEYGDTIDHILPKAHGGGETWDNVITACFSCNGKKGDTLLPVLGWELLYEPIPISRNVIMRTEQKEVDKLFAELTGATV